MKKCVITGTKARLLLVCSSKEKGTLSGKGVGGGGGEYLKFTKAGSNNRPFFLASKAQKYFCSSSDRGSDHRDDHQMCLKQTAWINKGKRRGKEWTRHNISGSGRGWSGRRARGREGKEKWEGRERKRSKVSYETRRLISRTALLSGISDFFKSNTPSKSELCILRDSLRDLFALLPEKKRRKKNIGALAETFEPLETQYPFRSCRSNLDIFFQTIIFGLKLNIIQVLILDACL